MGTYYTAACRPCRKTLELYKIGCVFRDTAERIEGQPAPILTVAAIAAGFEENGGEWSCSHLTKPLVEWVEKHSAHGPILLLNDYDDSASLVYDDPVPWEETDIDALCPR